MYFLEKIQWRWARWDRARSSEELTWLLRNTAWGIESLLAQNQLEFTGRSSSLGKFHIIKRQTGLEKSFEIRYKAFDHEAKATLQVGGLSCAHNLLVDCIDDWLRLNVKCPRFCCSVFPNLVPLCYPPSSPIPNSHSSYIFQASQFRASLRLLLSFDQSKKQVVEFIRRMEKDVDMRQPIKEAIHKCPILYLVEDSQHCGS